RLCETRSPESPPCRGSGISRLREYHANPSVCEPAHIDRGTIGWDQKVGEEAVLPPPHLDDAIERSSGALFGIFATSAQRILVTGRLRQPVGLGWVLPVDLALTRQVPVLLGPRIGRRVVHIDRGAGP